jgi:putative membrane protein
MFFWKTPAFGTTPEFAEKSAPLAANQGLYNGFLAAALIWGLIATDPTAFQFTLYVDGLYGAATANKRILFVQVLPGTPGADRWSSGGEDSDPDGLADESRTAHPDQGWYSRSCWSGASCRSVRCGRVRPVAGPFVAPRRLARGCRDGHEQQKLRWPTPWMSRCG